mmetsp:Transcript_13387/g.34875  ORF Transcript_13387/g.34875 Transcript_13387/m.34875 type:complete len:203 (+) Transcript_13387:479-1087(+)
MRRGAAGTRRRWVWSKAQWSAAQMTSLPREASLAATSGVLCVELGQAARYATQAVEMNQKAMWGASLSLVSLLAEGCARIRACLVQPQAASTPDPSTQRCSSVRTRRAVRVSTRHCMHASHSWWWITRTRDWTSMPSTNVGQPKRDTGLACSSSCARTRRRRRMPKARTPRTVCPSMRSAPCGGAGRQILHLRVSNRIHSAS